VCVKGFLSRVPPASFLIPMYSVVVMSFTELSDQG
jgi:hypothetical protein